MTRTTPHVYLGDPLAAGLLELTAGPFEVYAAAGGTDFDLGNLVPITQTVVSGLQDGTLVQWLRDDNRTVTLAFGVKGATLDALSSAVELSVVPFTSRQTLLTIISSEVAAEPAVFEVWTSALKYITDDLNENRHRRIYTLELTAQPYARSLFPTVSTAVQSSGAGTPVVLDNGSGGGWASALGGSVTSSGGVLSFPLVSIGGGVTSIQVTKTISSRNFTTTPQIYIDLNVPAGATNIRQQASVSGVLMNPTTITTPSAGVTRFWFNFVGAPAGSGTAVTLRFDFYGIAAGTMTGDNLTTTGPPPSINKAPIRTIPIQGSQRTPGSLRVADCTLVYTASGNVLATGYDPSLLTAASGPCPVGGYVVVISGTLTSTSGDPVTVTTTFTQGTATKTAKRVFVLPVVGGLTQPIYGTWAVGSLALPIFETPGVATVSGAVTVSGGTWTPQFGGDPSSWAFWMGKPGNNDQCALTIPKWTVTGSTITRKAYTWVDAPTIDRPYPGVWSGSLADKSNATNMVGSMERWGDHQFIPGYGTLYVIGGQADLSYYPRWHTWPVTLT